MKYNRRCKIRIEKQSVKASEGDKEKGRGKWTNLRNELKKQIKKSLWAINKLKSKHKNKTKGDEDNEKKYSKREAIEI
jgi:hypothetical protein